MPTTTTTTTTTRDLLFRPEDAALKSRFAPVFAQIATGAVDREQTRTLAIEAVERLREAGFGALRVPKELGGDAISLRQLFALLTLLAEADSNLPQILRAHFAFVEGRLSEPGAASDDWLRRVADGALFGAAMAERTAATETTTTLTRHVEGGWVLNGEKYYSTGTIYASWIVAIAREGADRVTLAVPVSHAGVSVCDDWDGFGQRLTGSGTTRFDRVHVADDNIIRRHAADSWPEDSYLIAFYQLFHLAALTGIARAVLRDAIAFVRARTRTFGVSGLSSPRHDPLVQRVVGRLAANAFTAETLVERLAGDLDVLHASKREGLATPESFVETDIAAFEAQQVLIDLVLQSTSQLFDIGGASATSETLRLDRHWRNARVLASHNPAPQRERAIGDWLLNGTRPSSVWTGGGSAPRVEVAS